MPGALCPSYLQEVHGALPAVVVEFVTVRVYDPVIHVHLLLELQAELVHVLAAVLAEPQHVRDAVRVQDARACLNLRGAPPRFRVDDDEEVLRLHAEVHVVVDPVPKDGGTIIVRRDGGECPHPDVPGVVPQVLFGQRATRREAAQDKS